MKNIKTYLGSIMLIAAFTACSSDHSQDAVMTHKSDSLSIVKSELSRDSLEIVFIAIINDIDRNLDLIRRREGVTILGPQSNADENLNQPERIMRNIQMINGLLEYNNDKIGELENLLADENESNEKLMRILKSRDSDNLSLSNDNERLKAQLSEKSYEIEDLNQKLTDAEIQKEILSWLIDDLNGEIYSAYYAIGTYKELKDHQLVEKNGGVLGMGKTKSLDEDFNQSYFTRIDTRLTQVIPIFGKKATLLSKHPVSSYSFVTEENVITRMNINDPQNFWKSNKYLVIEITI